MDETLLYKFTQHADLQAELLDTGDADLIEVNINILSPLGNLVFKSDKGFRQGCVLGTRIRWKRSQRTGEMPEEAENQTPG
jgi:hypothetical protein